MTKVTIKHPTNPKLQVEIREDSYGTHLFTMLNGFQNTGVLVTHDVLDMIEEAIKQYRDPTYRSPLSKEEWIDFIPGMNPDDWPAHLTGNSIVEVILYDGTFLDGEVEEFSWGNEDALSISQYKVIKE